MTAAATWSVPVADAAAAPPQPSSNVGAAPSAEPAPPEPDLASWVVSPVPGTSASQPDRAPVEALWGLTVTPAEPSAGASPDTPDVASDASLTDWAFDPTEAKTEPLPSTADRVDRLPAFGFAPPRMAPSVERESPPDIPLRRLELPQARQLPPASPAAQPPMSALERLEAREYRRRCVADAVAEPPHVARDPAPPSAPDVPSPVHEPMMADWIAEPAAAAPPATGPMLDANLFDIDTAPPATDAPARALKTGAALASDDVPDPARGSAGPECAEPSAFMRGMISEPAPDELSELNAPLPAVPAFPDAPQPAAESDDVPSVIQRLESMRAAIAALTEEVSEKKAGRRSELPP
ncbi:MAG: hypothetical protein GEU91_23780 [Rhizobiales bacterium]|nr:hypothetical protein [Hyphomicrobiales bacterium]